jgi:hypothetical protein
MYEDLHLAWERIVACVRTCNLILFFNLILRLSCYFPIFVTVSYLIYAPGDDLGRSKHLIKYDTIESYIGGSTVCISIHSLIQHSARFSRLKECSSKFVPCILHQTARFVAFWTREISVLWESSLVKNGWYLCHLKIREENNSFNLPQSFLRSVHLFEIFPEF